MLLLLLLLLLLLPTMIREWSGKTGPWVINLGVTAEHSACFPEGRDKVGLCHGRTLCDLPASGSVVGCDLGL